MSYLGINYYFSHCNRTHNTATGTINKGVSEFLPKLFQLDLLCAGYEAADSGPCEGDSGGPLVIYSTKKSHYIQIGLFAGTVAQTCGDRDYPGIYVRLDHTEVFDFIQKAEIEQQNEGIGVLYDIKITYIV